MYCVYWIKKDDQSDPLSEGYVGITTNLYERIRGHRKNRKINKLTSFLKKHWESTVIEILDMNLSQEEALELERYYRPTEDVGLNHQRGGELGVGPDWYNVEDNKVYHSKRTSERTIEMIALKDSTEARRIRAQLSWNNPDRRKTSVKGDDNPNASLTEEQVRVIKHELIPGGLTNPMIAKQFSVHPRVVRFIRIGKTWKHV